MHPLFEQTWQGRRVLLLQGPLGWFFWRLRRWLTSQGSQVHRLAFNGGDWLFDPGATRASQPSLLAWRSWLRNYLIQHAITDVMLFGDCRPVHRVAIRLAKRLGVRVWVFEEGYLRPNWITCELGGVNANSPLTDRLALQLEREAPSAAAAVPDGIKPNHRLAYQAMATQAAAYWLAAWLCRPLFRLPHHRSLNAPKEAALWLRGYARKLLRRLRGADVTQKAQSWRGPVMLVALQVHNDSQVACHSDYRDVRDFIDEVLHSFAAHAPSNVALLIKHHPMDRAYRDYGRHIAALSAQLGVANRVWIGYEEHLPTLLERVNGCITINSTVGLQALQAGVAVHVAGRAFYRCAGLTHVGTLHEFWSNWRQARPSRAMVERLLALLRRRVLINDHFYAPLRRWPTKTAPATPVDLPASNSMARHTA